jgi:NAD(P)H dehydrogenase (quinone)
MYAITGITGKVGGAVAAALLAADQPVRAIVRDTDKGAAWKARGCEVAIADIDDETAMTKALSGTDGVFLMNPPDYDPAPGFPLITARLQALVPAIAAAKPGKLVFLSTVGAQVTEMNLLVNAHMMENALHSLPLPVAFLRPAWFMENAAWDVAAARARLIPSFLQPLDHPIPMVATADIGRTGAALLLENWTGVRVVELEGPRRYSANDIATGFEKALGHGVKTQIVPKEGWEAQFRAQGMQHPLPRIRMLDGFNEGWIDFEFPAKVTKGKTDLDEVLRGLLA